jgi:hypothetical protein
MKTRRPDLYLGAPRDEPSALNADHHQEEVRLGIVPGMKGAGKTADENPAD